MLVIRQYRIFGIAIFDTVLSLILTVGLFLLARWKYFSNLSVWPFVIAGILLTIPIGIFIHVLFGVNTTLNYKLGLSNMVEK